MKSLRVFAIGGWLSYRALFSWLQPSLFVMVLLKAFLRLARERATLGLT